MLRLWWSLLCWGLLPQARGKVHGLIFLRVSNSQLETDISDLFSERQILKRLIRVPVMGSASEAVSVLDHLPYFKEDLVKKKSGLDLSLVGDLLSGKTVPALKTLLEKGGLIIEDAKGPEVTLEILSDSLLQVTLRCKLYLSLQELLWLKIIKNIRIGVRLEQIGNKTQVVFEECHTPPGYLSIEILETNSLLVNKLLKLLTSTLDESLPLLLQKIVCPVATDLLNLLLEDLLHITLPPNAAGPDDFQYYLTTTEFTQGAILMRVQLVTPCGPDQQAPRLEHVIPPPLPELAQDSMADFAFWVEIYNDILSCLYSSQEVHVEPQDDADLLQLLSLRASSQSNRGLTISMPDPPTVHLDDHTAKVIQAGELRVLGPNNTSSDPVAWQLLSEAEFSSKNQELKLQFVPHSELFPSSPPPAPHSPLQEKRLKTLLLGFLKRRLLPPHNKWLREHGLPLPNIKGISFSQAHMDFSKVGIRWELPGEEGRQRTSCDAQKMESKTPADPVEAWLAQEFPYPQVPSTSPVLPPPHSHARCDTPQIDEESAFL
uniref:BPI fold containing family B, member 5 n=1 Tax=Jaculus jaculus TaxID=51337 RepID=A0A8C5KPQ7_JACJA